MSNWSFEVSYTLITPLILRYTLKVYTQRFIPPKCFKYVDFLSNQRSWKKWCLLKYTISLFNIHEINSCMNLWKISVLNYAPRVPTFPTLLPCLRDLRAHVPACLCSLDELIFYLPYVPSSFYVPYVPSLFQVFLIFDVAYMPSLFYIKCTATQMYHNKLE